MSSNNPFAMGSPKGYGPSSSPTTTTTSPQQQANPKTAAVREQVDQVVGIMQDNISRVMERGEQLDTLQNKTDDLQASSLQFKRGAGRVRREMWWKDMKLRLIMGGIIVVVLIIIIGRAGSLCTGLESSNPMFVIHVRPHIIPSHAYSRNREIIRESMKACFDDASSLFATILLPLFPFLTPGLSAP